MNQQSYSLHYSVRSKDDETSLVTPPPLPFKFQP